MAKPQKPSAEEMLLTEYEKCQDSAEHNDKLIWQVTSILFVGIATIAGFAINADVKSVESYVVFAGLTLAGIYILTLTKELVKILSTRKDEKFCRCKQIETELGKVMKQHTSTKKSGGIEILNAILLTLQILLTGIVLIKTALLFCY